MSSKQEVERGEERVPDVKAVRVSVRSDGLVVRRANRS